MELRMTTDALSHQNDQTTAAMRAIKRPADEEPDLPRPEYATDFEIRCDDLRRLAEQLKFPSAPAVHVIIDVSEHCLHITGQTVSSDLWLRLTHPLNTPAERGAA